MENDFPRRKATRLKDFDYSTTGAYFVTVCTTNRRCLLSKIIAPTNGSIVGDGALDVPQVKLTEIGRIAEKHLLASERIQGVRIDRYVIMPNHIHAIIAIKADENDEQVHGTSRAPSPTNKLLPHIVATFKRFCHKEIGQVVFQRSFHDHVIRDYADYDEIAKYIAENPIRWRLDTLYAEE
ncbi:MAG: hypothetical protein IJW89_00485 [Clostridia bacterium]|nr:hypothetical protein [Clostridia bacterium]